MTPSAPLAVPAADPDRIAVAVQACPSVVRLSGGAIGEVATYLPGRRITGVRITADGGVEVHVVARYGPTIDEIAAEVRKAVTAVTGSRRVWVGVDDLDITALSSTVAAPRVR